MQILNICVKDLTPYANNPRRNDDTVSALAESIKEFGFKVPIVIDKNNVIVCGDTRLKAAKKLGLKQVPCVMADDLTDEQVKAFRLADNKIAELSTWDIDKLKLEIQGLKDLDLSIDLSKFGFDKDLLCGDSEEDEFDFDIEAEKIAEPITQRGDLWLLGKHRLLCGDACNAEDLARLMNGVKADTYLTDPPYNVDYEGKAGKIKNDSMTDVQFCEFLTTAFKNASEHLKSGGAFYIWHADSEGYNFRAACNNASFKVRQCLIWLKNSIVLGRQDYQWKHEPCLYGWKGGGSHTWLNNRKQTTILEFDRPAKSRLHPTMKPVRLFDYLIRNSTPVGGIVLDTFAGSGTTLIACAQNNRLSYSIELEEKNCDVIVKRYERLIGAKAERIPNGKTEN